MSEDELDKGCEADPKRLDVVLEDATAGGPIMASSPTLKAKVAEIDEDTSDEEYFGSQGREDNIHHMGIKSLLAITPTTAAKLVTYELNIPGHYDESFKTRIQANASTDVIADFIRQRGEELDALDANINEAVRSFLKEPESFIVDNDQKSGDWDGVGGGGKGQAEHPVFIKVINKMPVAMFWAAVMPVAWCVNKAYDAMADKFNFLAV